MLRTRTLATALLPTSPGVQLTQVQVSADQITTTVVATQSGAACPVCGQRSRSIHSRYQRALADLPWGGLAVRLHLVVRKFFCAQPECPRRIFTERLPALVAPYARRTLRLAEVLRLLAFALGGEPGARLVVRLQMTVSAATLLRLIRRTPLAAAPIPHVLGVDDWAFRRGHRYGTILVDLEQHRVIDLLPDRTAETLATWLRDHPGLEVISRDRARAYAEGARTGAPDAVQVADRWHLLKNLVEALERCLLRQQPALAHAAAQLPRDRGPLPSYADAEQVPWQQRAEAASQQKHAPRLEHYQQVHALYAVGVTKLEIARRLGISRPTVYRYLSLDHPPERRQPHRAGRRALEPYEPYLLQRWQEGCRQRSRLFREIQARGYRHGASTVFRFLKRLEREREQLGHGATISGGKGPTARRVASLMVQRSDALTEEERGYLERLCAQEPAVAALAELTQEFTSMVRQLQGQRLEAWLAKVSTSEIPELCGFARGLTDDRAAVEAGLRLKWSNGQTEGQVNKLKLLKRQMYGRANFDLLRRRALQVA